MNAPSESIPTIRKANRAATARFFGVSPPTLDSWIAAGCPSLRKGAKGTEWAFDLLTVAQWRYGPRQSPAGEEFDPDKLQPGERKAWYESEVKRRDLQVRDRELIPVSEVQTAIATAFAAISQDLRAIPDNLERKAGIGADTAEVVEVMINEAMNGLADRLATLAPAGIGEGGA